ncbi:hypothetical protein EVAR_99491_1 [Eumeta japonica]|uniref:Uncharacterized protein n=1 Tax=Eumeta variegata TaxID=151549 RepID=A0A4C1Z4V3_EUMVA|nr:hypothetical protein EVAR_99491_1 [Eumeta japonica]
MAGYRYGRSGDLFVARSAITANDRCRRAARRRRGVTAGDSQDDSADNEEDSDVCSDEVDSSDDSEQPGIRL